MLTDAATVVPERSPGVRFPRYTRCVPDKTSGEGLALRLGSDSTLVPCGGSWLPSNGNKESSGPLKTTPQNGYGGMKV